METTKTITERGEVVVNETTTIDFSYEHEEGANPAELKASVNRRNAGENGTSVTIIRGGYNVATTMLTLSTTNAFLGDKEVINAIVDGFESILNDFE